VTVEAVDFVLDGLSIIPVMPVQKACQDDNATGQYADDHHIRRGSEAIPDGGQTRRSDHRSAETNNCVGAKIL